MVEIACPRCSSTEAEQANQGVFVCSHCHTRFIVDHGQARLPDQHATTSAAATPSSGRLVALVVSGVAVAILIVGGVVAALFTSADGGADSRAVRRSPLTRTDPQGSSRSTPPPAISAVPQVEPKATLVNSLAGQTSIGGHFWLATYRNDGEVTLRKPAATASLFDEGGKRVGEQRGYSQREELPPGESATILILVSKPPKYARAEINIDDPQVHRGAESVALKVQDHVVNPGAIAGKDVVGTIVNDSDTAVRFAKVIVVGRNEAGEPVDFAYAYATDKDLAPGESSGFKATLNTWQIAPPKTIEVRAFGRPG
ncbi:MAG: FxLYD domain-containing protein [Myxococcales bacterium]|nr:FxLYD domain-containing protein [Myxococcales bacterium]